MVAAVDAHVLHERLELVGEEVGRPERRVGVGQVLAAPVADLVVEHAGAPGPAQPGDRRDVVVRGPGAAVQHDHRRLQGVGVELPDHPEPGAAAIDEQLALHPSSMPARRLVGTCVLSRVLIPKDL